MLTLSDFAYHLPEENIAVRPVEPRDSARLLVVQGDVLHDHIVTDLPGFLRPGDVMVFNDTRVIPARLWGQVGPARVEVMLHKREADNGGICWRAFARPGKKLKPGGTVDFAENFHAEVVEKFPEGDVLVRFPYTEAAFLEKLSLHGHLPLPPYIRREDDAQDASTYQTVYARHDGSVAAPTAGLHFTPELLAAIDAAGVKRVHVTLHVGAGTFLPVKVENIAEHTMHSEIYEVSPEVAATINAAKAAGGRVIAVGTTSLRTLESVADDAGVIHAGRGETCIFITPGYRFKAVELLFTNFHLPKSTLLMLVAAFAGLPQMRQAYQHAIATGYRFYSYGDASLLTLSPHGRGL